jgi:hypothetical protein
MKLKILYSLSFLAIASTLMLSSSCNPNSSNKAITAATSPPPLVNRKKKAASIYQDTLIISTPAAVFYHPDPLQLIKMKAQTDSLFYEGAMHEYFFQMKNAHIAIKKNWPRLTIMECKNYRHLAFIKKNGTREYIDLDAKNDPYGLFVFDGKKPPLSADMTNLETVISFYFSD